MHKKQISDWTTEISSHAVVFAVFLKLPPILTLTVKMMDAEMISGEGRTSERISEELPVL